MPPKKQIYQFKVTLQDIKPPIWRRIQVPSTYTFWDLHVAIQDAMGWQDYHLHEFRVKDQSGMELHIGIPAEENQILGPLVFSGWRQEISALLSTTHPTFKYVYDFGDDWHHTIKLEKILPAKEGVAYPRCIGGKRNSPPEDCGGPHGYQNMLEVLDDPEDSEHQSTGEWVDSMKGGTFDPNAFNPSDVKFDNPSERFRVAFEEE